jgi:hypothetical protein
MTEWYTHFDPNEFNEIRKAQEALLRPEPEKAADTGKAQKKPGKQEAGELAGGKGKSKVLPFRGKETGQTKRKQA